LDVERIDIAGAQDAIGVSKSLPCVHDLELPHTAVFFVSRVNAGAKR
jgi:hypothetical protein